MTPVTFDGCAGWLRIGSGPIGVVICAPFGREGMLSYRGCKILADDLHARNFSVLRFDYSGTGDSGGSEADPDRLHAWESSLASAVAFLRRTTQIQDIILIGIRLGATLALRAAAIDTSVIAVCCLSPVVSGRSYARELRLLANGWREANLLPAPKKDVAYLDVVGDRLDNETLRALSAIDLRTLAGSPPDVLLVADGHMPLIDDLTGRLQELGARVLREDFLDGTDFLQDPFSTTIPHHAFAIIADWCVRLLPQAVLPATSRPVIPQPASLLRLPEATEEGLHFGPGNGLYGVLCLPFEPQASTVPTVLMLNTGFGRRTGDGRVFVILARRLAQSGIASLRLDVAGFGESDSRSEATADPYEPQITDDVVAAADALGSRGHDRLIVIGICSGANAAFHAGLREPRVHGLILTNLQKFIWQRGSTFRIENKRQRRPALFYLRSITRRAAWLRLLRGDVAVGSIGAALMRRLAAGAYNSACLLIEDKTGLATRAGQVRRWLTELGGHGTRVDLLYSEADPGLSELALVVGKRSSSLERLAHVKVEVIPGADHALLDHVSRERFIEHVCRIIHDSTSCVATGNSSNP